jgi:glycosyltransferase involved in cell wall biosynthesis
MILVNLFNIKNTNGLFYYGIDYIKTFRKMPDRVLVRPVLFQAISEMCSGVRIVPCTFFSAWVELLKAALSGKTIYTPTSHPLPFVNRQVVVLHDTYPFAGRLGWLKARLFLLSARTSRCLLAYINVTDGLAFYRRHGFDENRLVFAPNRFSGAIARHRSMRPEGERRLIVGLVGTDSPKKNYAALFSAVRASAKSHDVVFAVYGHATEYFRSLQANFSDLAIQLIESDHSALSVYLAGLDVLVSVAANEGFGRPIASALESGVPCFLLEYPVFREFFGEGARFFGDTSSLVSALFEAWSRHDLIEVSYQPPATIVAAFATAAGRLEDLGSGPA